MFSSRLPKDLDPSPFFAELEAAKAEVRAVCESAECAEHVAGAIAGGEACNENVAGGETCCGRANGFETSKDCAATIVKCGAVDQQTAARKDCASFIDMTVSSPLRVGLPFDLEPAVDAARGEFGTWVADAAGRKDAREAVAEYYRERGGWFTSEQILLTASTSEAYSILFKTFCDPGDVILTPMPGYPLLDTLAQLEHLECYPYFLKLVHEKPLRSLAQLKHRETVRDNLGAQTKSQSVFRFVIDTDSLLSAPDNAKILLLVSPHNPTGHCVSEKEWNEIVTFCEQRNMVLVVDEVFGDYAIDPKVRRSWEFLSQENSAAKGALPKCPIFWLNGLSKTVGSPQLKLGWMAFYAPEKDFEPVRAALEFVADAYLSVSAPAQALARPMLTHAAAYEAAIRERTSANWATLREAFPSKYCPEVLGGWYAAVRLGDDDEELTLRLLREKHLLVQPGFFFDFDEDGWVVISLLPPPDVFAEGVRRMLQ